MNRALLTLFLSLFTTSVLGQDQTDPESDLSEVAAVTAIIPIFSQRIAFQLPVDWHPVFQDGNARFYIIEFTPRDQSIEDWREMITVQGFKGYAGQETASQVLDTIVNQIQLACPDTLIDKRLGATEIDGHQAQVALMGCGEMPTDMPTGLKAGQSEVAYYLSITGRQDHYVFQKATRGEALGSSDLPDTQQDANHLISRFEPIQICKNEGRPVDCLK